MMSRFALKITVVFFGLLLCGTAIADEQEESDTVFQITPRVWLSYLNIVNDEETSTDAIFLPLAGLTASLSPTRNLNLIVSGYYGTGDADYVNTVEGTGTTEVQRMDIEFLVRYNLPGKYISIFAGPRYVEINEENKANGFKATDDSTIWLAELGLGAAANISDSGRHRLFANFMAAAAFSDYEYEDTNGFKESGSGTYPAFDFNLGYQYIIGTHFSFNIRYRAFLIYEENDFEHMRLNTLHGPEFALTLSF